MAEFDRSITGPRSTLVFLRMATEPVPVGCDRAILVSEKALNKTVGEAQEVKTGKLKQKLEQRKKQN